MVACFSPTPASREPTRRGGHVSRCILVIEGIILEKKKYRPLTLAAKPCCFCCCIAAKNGRRTTDAASACKNMLKEVQELSGAESEAMVSLAQRAAFAADTLTEEDVTTMRNWYKRLKGNKKA